MSQHGSISSTTRLVEPFQYSEPTTNYQSYDNPKRLPLPPRRRKAITPKDVYTLLSSLTALALCIMTVFFQALATYLGVLNQLIVIGFLLGLMALLLQAQVLRTLMVFHGRRRVVTLQDIDGTLRQDLFAPQVSVWLRGILLALLALPLGLSVSYKLFVGGSSSKILHSKDGLFGFSATPGNQRIGDGLTLLADLYRPFWIDPGVERAYGFNLFVQDNETAVIVDTPYPRYLTYLQSLLENGETMTLKATVNATVARQMPITDAERVSEDYWNSVLEFFGHNATVNGGNIAGANNGLLAGRDAGGIGILSNFSIAYFSAWNTTRNETFQSEALRIDNYRAIYQATWNISNANVSLVSAAPAESAKHWWESKASQFIIQNDYLGVQEMFSNFLGEYDWHNRAGFSQFPYPGPNTADAGNDSVSGTCPGDISACKWWLGVNTVPALSAATIWARTTSLNGGDRPVRDPDRVIHTMYTKPVNDVETIKFIPTLKRTFPMLLVLLTNPTITMFCVVVKWLWLRPSVVGDDFTAVDLLGAGKGGNWVVLRGAENGSRLETKIGVRFVEDDDGEVKIVLAHE